MSSSANLGGRLIELGTDECWDLLHAESVGRVAWTTGGVTTVLPVNYIVVDKTVVFRTSPYSAMARECDSLPVAFEIDEVDPFTRSGWSVLARGTAQLVYDDHLVPDDGQQLDTWAGGARPLHLVLEPVELTGRRLLPS
jgi:hypothetical protein